MRSLISSRPARSIGCGARQTVSVSRFRSPSLCSAAATTVPRSTGNFATKCRPTPMPTAPGRSPACSPSRSNRPRHCDAGWQRARPSLELGLRGTYADVAAAFGASDPRGPRAFALAYAAQRQALATSSIDDADRFAPELAHAGTSEQRDSWSGATIPPSLGSFDPFTLFYYHWIITKGRSGTLRLGADLPGSVVVAGPVVMVGRWRRLRVVRRIVLGRLIVGRGRWLRWLRRWRRLRRWWWRAVGDRRPDGDHQHRQPSHQGHGTTSSSFRA